MASQYGVHIDLRPCDIGKVFNASGGLPLVKRAPQRQAYRLVELQRWSQHLEIPLILQPKFFPVPPDLAAKLIIATQLAHGTATALALTGAIMAALWAEDRNIADVDTLANIAINLDLDGKALLKSAETASVQSEFDQYTDKALEANVFGSPWYVFEGEGFWGQDRLDFVERAFAK
jgi:2-hydroxychromene-2-carboxylate isomerase